MFVIRLVGQSAFNIDSMRLGLMGDSDIDEKKDNEVVGHVRNLMIADFAFCFLLFAFVRYLMSASSLAQQTRG